MLIATLADGQEQIDAMEEEQFNLIVQLATALLHGLALNVKHVDCHKDIVELVELSMLDVLAHVTLAGVELNVMSVHELTLIVVDLLKEELTTRHVVAYAIHHGLDRHVINVQDLLHTVKMEELSVQIV